MRRPLLLGIVAAGAAAVALIARAGAAGDATRFRTPEAGAACRLERTALVCGSLASPASLVLRARGAPTVVRRLPWWDASTRVLHHWTRNGITCDLRGAAIVCRNHGAALSVSRAGLTVAL